MSRLVDVLAARVPRLRLRTVDHWPWIALAVSSATYIRALCPRPGRTHWATEAAVHLTVAAATTAYV
ncbi:hypothetical protein GCM10020218_052890 [Dactylosporangium vinaceum]